MKKAKPPSKPYGFVLVLRGLASAAIRLYDRPAALRVLCVAAEYMNQDGICKISQDTIAARLDITRQAVNKHLAELDRMEILCSDASRDGILKSYYLDMEGLEDERFGQDRVDARRAAKREAKRGQFDPASLEPKQKADEADEAPEAVQTSDSSAASDSNWMIGSDAEHRAFGRGVITEVDGNKITVDFACGRRKVVLDFITVHAKRKGATQ